MGKGAVGSALNNIAELLKKEKICANTKPLSDAAKDLITRNDSPNMWGYNLQKLIFNNLEVPRGTEPSNVSTLTATLSVEIHEKDLDVTDVSNPIIVNKATRGVEKKYNLSIEVSGLVEDDTEINKVLSYWHLDYDNNNENEYVHPDFHLTFGGKTMSKIKLGNVLLLPAPRLPHPPMDAILGIDFIISHFIKKDKSYKILNDPQYKKAVKSSQERLWKPYMLATANHWCNFSCSKFQGGSELAGKYCPSLISIVK